MVQWTSTAGRAGSIPGQGTNMLQGTLKQRGKNRSGDQNTGRMGPGTLRNMDTWGQMEAGVRQEEGSSSM